MAALPFADTASTSTTTASSTATADVAAASGSASQSAPQAAAKAATDGAVTAQIPGVGSSSRSNATVPLAADGTASCRLSVPALFDMPSPDPVTSLLRVSLLTSSSPVPPGLSDST